MGADTAAFDVRTEPDIGKIVHSGYSPNPFIGLSVTCCMEHGACFNCKAPCLGNMPINIICG